MRSEYAGIEQGTRIGQSGLEQKYDKYLRGTDGSAELVVDAFGSRDDQRQMSVKEPEQGQRLKLTLDYDLQKAGDEALAQAIAASQHGAQRRRLRGDGPDATARSSPWARSPASTPACSPAVLAEDLDFLTSRRDRRAAAEPRDGVRLSDRLRRSSRSRRWPRSTRASIEPDHDHHDDGKYELGPQKYQNAKGASFGTINISDALKVSSDVFFYHLGEWADAQGHADPALGASGSASAARPASTSPASCPAWCPTASGAPAAYERYEACREKAGSRYQGTTAALYECGGIDKRVDDRRQRQPRRRPGRPPGHAAAGRGRLRRARQRRHDRARRTSARRSRTATASRSRSSAPSRSARSRSTPRDRQVVLDGLRRAASEDDGTSADVFKDFPSSTRSTARRAPSSASRTRTRPGTPASSRTPDKPIVVVVTVERGGFGAETAAPAARLILSAVVRCEEGPRVPRRDSDQSN